MYFLFPVHMYEALRKQSILHTSEHSKNAKGSGELVIKNDKLQKNPNLVLKKEGEKINSKPNYIKVIDKNQHCKSWSGDSA